MEYQEFRQEYESQHPASVPQPEVYMSEYDKWVIYVVAGMFITAAFFSGIHTVPIAYGAIDAKAVADWIRQAGAVSTFVFVEAGVLLSAYLIVKKFSLIMLIILVITITVAMGANLYSVAKAMQDVSSEGFTKVITVLFGLVAPLMAALSGGVFVWLHQSDRNSDAKTKINLRKNQIEWDSEIEQAWKKYQKNSSKELSNGIPLENSAGISIPVGNSNGKRKSNAGSIVASYLEEHPDHLGMSVSDLIAHLGVGKSTVYNMMKDYKGEVP